jgi:hypothetical protein
MPGFVRNIELQIRQGLDARVDAMATRGIGNKKGTLLRSGLLEPTETSDNFKLSREAQVVKSPFVRMISPGEKKTHVLYGMFNLDDIAGTAIGGAAEDTDYFESLAGKVQGPEFAYYGATRGEDSDGNLDSNYLKPKPGISGVTVNFIKFGGAVRKATVKWTCWTLDQLAMYQKGSFLSAGRNVILDWGWVRGEKGLEQVPKILVTDGKKVMLDKNLFLTPLVDGEERKASKSPWDKLYLSHYGDWSGMIGTVTKFDWEMRDDGGFDCTTELMARGSNVFEKPMKPAQSELGSTVPTMVPTFSEAIKDIMNNVTDEDINDTIASFANVPLLNITERIASLDIELISKYFTKTVDGKPILTFDTDAEAKVVVSTDKCCVAILRGADKDDEGNIQLTQPKEAEEGKDEASAGIERAKNFSSDIWIRWGWLEDNIVSYYASHSKTGESDQRLAEFRSIMGVTGKLTSVVIKNDPELLTHDPGIFVLPGQYDPEYHLDVAKFDDTLGKAVQANIYKELATEFDTVEAFAVNDTKTSGYLRNIFINLTQVQSCFSSPGASIQSAMLRLANKLNIGVPIWKFEIDQVENLSSARVTYFISEVTSPPTKEETDKKIDNDPKTSYVFENFGYNSIVKDISMSSTIPDKFAISAGLGAVREEESGKLANKDPVKAFLRSAPPDVGEEEKAVQAVAEFMADKKNAGVLNTLESKLGKNVNFGGSTENNGVMKADDEKELRTTGLKGGDFNHTISETLVNINPTARVSYSQQFIDKYMDSLKTQEGILDAEIEGSGGVMGSARAMAHAATTKEGKGMAKEFAKPYDLEGKLRPHYLKTMKWYLSDNPLSPVSSAARTMLLPIEVDMTIEGCAGIFPGHMFRLAYLPKEYGQTGLDVEHSAKTYFSIMDVTHTISRDTWSTQLRAKLNKVASTEKAGVVEGDEATRIAAKKEMMDKINKAYTAAVEKFKVPVIK